MKKFSILITIILCGFFAKAQNSLSDSAHKAKELEDIRINSKKGLNNQSITIGKIAINPLDLPQSVMVINEKTIEKQQSQRLSDIIKNVNGVYLSSTRGSVQETFAARGYRMGSDNLYKNGARINSGVMPEVSSLEKVEVLKGSAAILYGNVAPGGILNLVTKQPKDYYGGEISFRTGSFGLIKPTVDVYGPMSKKIFYRVNGTYEKTNSYRDVVHSEKKYINPSLLFKLNNTTTLLVQGDYLYQNFTPDFGIGSIDNNKISNLPRNTFLGTSWQYNKQQQTTANATLAHNLSESWKLELNGSYQLYHRNYYSTERIQAAANGDWKRSLNKIESNEDYVVTSANLTGKFKTNKIQHTLLTGLDADRYFTTTYGFNNPKIYDTINILNPAKFISRNDIPSAEKTTRLFAPRYRLGAYVQDLMSISEKLKLLAGLRYSVENAQAPKTTFILNDSLIIGLGKNDHAFSPRVGLVYKPVKNISTYLSYANSFSANSGTTATGNTLPSSIIDQYEAGIKTELLKGNLSINITTYLIKNNNLAQTAQFLADGITPNNNTNIKELSGQTKSKGIEIDLSSRPVKDIDIIAGYSFNDYRYTNVQTGKGNYIEGDRIVNTPVNTANLSLWYNRSNALLKGLKIGITAVYIGDRYGGWNNQQQQTQNYDRRIFVKGFSTLDISTGYSFKNLSAFIKLANLFNTYNYNVHENYSINPIAPRSIVATLAYKF